MALLKSKWTWWCLLLVLSGAGVLAWMERASIAAWHHARNLVRASETERARRLQELAALEHAAIPALLKHLDSSEEPVRANAAWALVELARQWGPRDAKTRVLVTCIGEGFDGWTGDGQGQALRVLKDLMALSHPKRPSKELVQLGRRLLTKLGEEATRTRSRAPFTWRYS